MIANKVKTAINSRLFSIMEAFLSGSYAPNLSSDSGNVLYSTPICIFYKFCPNLSKVFQYIFNGYKTADIHGISVQQQNEILVPALVQWLHFLIPQPSQSMRIEGLVVGPVHDTEC